MSRLEPSQRLTNPYFPPTVIGDHGETILQEDFEN